MSESKSYTFKFQNRAGVPYMLLFEPLGQDIVLLPGEECEVVFDGSPDIEALEAKPDQLVFWGSTPHQVYKLAATGKAAMVFSREADSEPA